MTKGNHPSYQSCVANILSASAAPLTMDTLLTRIEAQRPVGKGVRSAVYQAINKLYQAISVAPGQYGWLSSLLKNQWFRHPLNSVEIRKGFLLLDELEHAVFFPEFFQAHQADNRTVRIELLGGPTIEAQADIEQGTWALRLGLPFVEWVDQIGGATHDDLLIWVKDAQSGDYGIRLQPRESRQEEVIDERNRKLVWLAEEIVSNDRKTRTAIPVWELAAALIGRGLYANDVPPDDMHYVLHEYSRLRLYDDLGYAFEDQIPPLRAYSQAENRLRRTGTDLSAPSPWMQSESSWPTWQEEFEASFLSDSFDFDDASLEDSYVGDSYFDDGYAEEMDILWTFPEEVGEFEDDADLASEYCEGYQSYLAEFYNGTSEQPPLSHMEFHLLEAELEMLVGLEQEFGYLMPEQEDRKNELAERLFIDLNYFYDDSDWDQSDYDDPPYWQN
jgi:hypothetical protein